MSVSETVVNIGESGPSLGKLESYRFILVNHMEDTYGNPLVTTAYIKNLPKDQLVMQPDEARHVSNLLDFHEDMAKEGYAEPIAKGKGEPLLTREGAFVLGRAVMAGQQTVFAPELVTKRREADIVTATASRAWDRLILSNLRLVGKVVGDQTENASEDLFQEGTIGLMRAASKFDYRKGLAFSTFSLWWVRQAIQRARDVRGYAVRAPTAERRLFPALQRCEKDLGDLMEKSLDDISKSSGIPLGEVEAVRRAYYVTRGTRSLDTSMQGIEGQNLHAMIGTKEDIGQTVASSLTIERLDNVISNMPKGERNVMRLVVGNALEGDTITFADISKLVDITAPTVIKHKKNAVARILHPTIGLAPELVQDGKRTAWFNNAACKGSDQKVYFSNRDKLAVEERTVRCLGCPVRAECLEFAQQMDIQKGCWGGFFTEGKGKWIGLPQDKNKQIA